MAIKDNTYYDEYELLFSQDEVIGFLGEEYPTIPRGVISHRDHSHGRHRLGDCPEVDAMYRSDTVIGLGLTHIPKTIKIRETKRYRDLVEISEDEI